MERTDSGLQLVSGYGFDDDEDDDLNESYRQNAPSQGVDNISGSDDDEGVAAKAVKRQREEPSVEDEEVPKFVKLEKEESTSSARGTSRLVSYLGDDDMDEEEDAAEEEKEDIEEKPTSDNEASPDSESYSNARLIDYDVSITSDAAGALHHPIQDEDEILLPPEPPGKCSNKLQEKIADLHDKVHKRGYDLNASIQRRKDFRNPSIYEKLIEFCAIDEKGTNYPPELYDPSFWGPDSYYDELARLQKIEMDKREKEKKDRTKVEFVVGTKKSDGELKRKSKWDSQPQVTSLQKPTIITTTVLNPPVVSVTTSSSGTKTTVISAVGTITKKK